MRWREAVRAAGEAMLLAAEAQGQWEIDVARTIFTSRARRRVLLVLLLLAVAPAFVSVALADSLPQVLGGRQAYAPALFATETLGAAVAIGLVAGLITGCIGAGGGFIITPAMMSAGVKGIMAVGTDMFHIFAKAILGTAIHHRMGNVSVKLALAFVVGSGLGVSVGAATNRAIYRASPVLSNAFIGLMYALLLGFLGIYALADFLRLRKRPAGSGPDQAAGGVSPPTRLAAGLQAVRLPPRVRFDERFVPGGRKIWAGFVAACGFVVGFVAAIMGVGGGFLTFPAFVYALGVSEPTTVGTDIFQIIFTAGYASVFQYAVYGYVFYTLAMGLLLGSLVGIQIGSFASKAVPPLHIRGFYAVAILAGFFNRLMALPRQLSAAGVLAVPQAAAGAIDVAGQVLFFVTVGVFGLWVIGAFFANFRRLREP